MTAKIGSSRVVIRIAAWLLGLALPAGHASAQTAKDLVGTWSVASVTVEQSGTKVEPYGSDPEGILMLDENGRYTVMVLRPDLPTFASNSRTAGTLEENGAVVQGSIAHFGTYAVEGADTLVFRIEASTFPNWDGAEQKRPFMLTGGKLEYTVPAASGGGTAQVVWTRAK
ncbi:MAG: lipocalin-like domain-containing protein [Geminicoccaceae bacterium]